MGIIYELVRKRLQQEAFDSAAMANGDWEFDFDDLDYLGISESEAEDLRTNVDQNTEDVSPDAAEKEGQDEEGN